MSPSKRKDEIEALLSAYVDLCNRVIAENRDKFWYRQAKRLQKALWEGDANFRTLVYDQDPGEPLAEFTLNYDPDRQVLSVKPGGEKDIALRWRVSLDYLRDVVETRPEWYQEQPLRLDWKWIGGRLADEVQRPVEVRSLALGMVLGAGAALLLSGAFSRGRDA